MSLAVSDSAVCSLFAALGSPVIGPINPQRDPAISAALAEWERAGKVVDVARKYAAVSGQCGGFDMAMADRLACLEKLWWLVHRSVSREASEDGA